MNRKEAAIKTVSILTDEKTPNKLINLTITIAIILCLIGFILLGLGVI